MNGPKNCVLSCFMGRWFMSVENRWFTLSKLATASLGCNFWYVAHIKANPVFFFIYFLTSTLSLIFHRPQSNVYKHAFSRKKRRNQHFARKKIQAFSSKPYQKLKQKITGTKALVTNDKKYCNFSHRWHAF
jgi:hypothetical protein